ncbi:MAG: EF-hand domain-containing protein [Pseudomonadota bacterium]
MRLLTPFLAASTLVLAMAACSPKPAEATPTENTGMAVEPSAGTTDADDGETAAPSGAADAAADQDRPQGMPADPDRPRGRGFEGNMTLADMQARSDRRFDRMDANGDGVITSEEMGDEGGRGGRMLERADANNDGRITRAEMQAGSQAMFRRMDSNGDGKVTEEERPQF